MYEGERALQGASVMDAFCAELTSGLAYGPKAPCSWLCRAVFDPVCAWEERDMIVMHHSFGAQFPDGRREEHESSYMDYGEAGGETRTCGVARSVTGSVNLEARHTRMC